jgi:SET domain-containing protein
LEGNSFSILDTSQSIEGNDFVTIKDAGKMGHGVFARTTIPADVFLGNYEGEKIDEQECNKRCDKGNGLYIIELGKKTFIDAMFGGNWTCMVNHSRDPNVHAISDYKFQRVLIYSTREIKKGEQLFMNYGESWFEDNGLEEL